MTTRDPLDPLPPSASRPLTVVAMGGHAFLQEGERGTIEEHEENAERVVDLLMALVERGHRLVMTHGNGPQVGNLLTQQELAGKEAPSLPLDVLVAMTQGSLGYVLQQALLNRLRERYPDRRVMTIVTQVLVDGDDPAFEDPSKPVGPFFSQSEAEARAEASGWTIREDPERGWRRVVPSPRPLEVLQYQMIREAAAAGHIVIAGGGGGIPILEDADGRLSGVEGVVDKDLTSSVLANRIGASLLVILTAVPQVYRHFGTAAQEAIGAVTLEEIERLADDGHFPPGSMGPKVQAVIEFLRGGGARALITDADSLPAAMEGRAGTHVVGRI
jgi:carbamate kinase